jgi:transcriptional regulator with XRE-family HTH domain
MHQSVFSVLGGQLRRWRERRGMSQPALAQRLGRDRARISELERDLIGERWGRDRLTLFAEICDALDVVPVLVPRHLASTILANAEGEKAVDLSRPVPSRFDQLFVDLSDDEDEEA